MVLFGRSSATYPTGSEQLVVTWTSDNINLTYVNQTQEIPGEVAFSTPVHFVLSNNVKPKLMPWLMLLLDDEQ